MPRVVPLAEKYKLTVGVHGHSNLKDPNEFATPESFVKAMAMSKYIGVNLDIGHFAAAGYDPIEFIQAHHDRITNLHLKDRNKSGGANMSFGEGATPIKEGLNILRENKYNIPAHRNDACIGSQVSDIAVK